MEFELQRLLCENLTVCAELLSREISEQSFKDSCDKVKFYTDLPNCVLLVTVFNFVAPFVNHTQRNCLDKFKEYSFIIIRFEIKLINSPL